MYVSAQSSAFINDRLSAWHGAEYISTNNRGGVWREVHGWEVHTNHMYFCPHCSRHIYTFPVLCIHVNHHAMHLIYNVLTEDLD